MAHCLVHVPSLFEHLAASHSRLAARPAYSYLTDRPLTTSRIRTRGRGKAYVAENHGCRRRTAEPETHQVSGRPFRSYGNNVRRQPGSRATSGDTALRCDLRGHAHAATGRTRAGPPNPKLRAQP